MARRAPPSEVYVTYQQLPIRCGKERCRCSVHDTALWHGPYWYAFWNDPETGRKRSCYLGKDFEAPVRDPPLAGFGELGPVPGAEVREAREILGVLPNASRTAATAAWHRARARQPRATMRIDVAWNTYARQRGWT